MRTRLVIFGAAFLLQGTFFHGAYGDIILRYDFQGQPGDQISQSASFVDANGTAGSLIRGAGLTISAAGDSISSAGFATGPSVELTDYYGFSISTNTGQQLTLNNISFNERRSGTGIREFEIRTSTDGFITFDSQYIGGVPDDTNFRDQSITISGLTNVQGTVDFRIYGYNAESAAGTWRITNHTTTGGLTLDGTFAPAAVPEPSSFMFLGIIGITCMAARVGRRRCCSDET